MATSTIGWEGCTINGVNLNPGQNKDSRTLKIAVNVQSTNNYSSAKTVANSTYVDLCSLSLGAGLWIIRGHINYPAANNTGYRRACIDDGKSDAPLYSNMRPSPSGYQSIAPVLAIREYSATTTVKLQAYQNSGGSLTGVYGYLYATQLY